jgi:DTW domain-containing protein YfiP
MPGVDVLILQHPMEADNPKGTARLLHLSLSGSQLLRGETFAPGVLHKALHAPTAAGEAVQPLLLYPADLATPADSAAESAALPSGPVRIRLVVIDGTWRKSRKMLYKNPQLQALPRCALADVAPSRYVIRKAHALHQLSTLEATCAALVLLEGAGSADKFMPLLAAMDALVAQQLVFSRATQAVI